MSTPLPEDLPAALADAVALLRALALEDADGAATLEAFRAAHPGFRATLCEDRPPGSGRVERDLHLEHEALGGVSVAWREQDGSPWALLYADHWASQYVLSVDERPVTIREALLTLRLEGARSPDLVTALVNRELVASAVAALDPPVSAAAVQAERDRLIRRHGLEEEEALEAWLRDMEMTRQDLAEVARESARTRAWEDAVTSGSVRARFEAAPGDWERVAFVDLTGGDAAEALREEVAGGTPWTEALEALPPGAHVTVRSGFAGQVTRWGAEPGRACFVLSRWPAELDAATAAAIRRVLLEEWLEERRRQARIRWYWR